VPFIPPCERFKSPMTLLRLSIKRAFERSIIMTSSSQYCIKSRKASSGLVTTGVCSVMGVLYLYCSPTSLSCMCCVIGKTIVGLEGSSPWVNHSQMVSVREVRNSMQSAAASWS
jgi:hypothetical protein